MLQTLPKQTNQTKQTKEPNKIKQDKSDPIKPNNQTNQTDEQDPDPLWMLQDTRCGKSNADRVVSVEDFMELVLGPFGQEKTFFCLVGRGIIAHQPKSCRWKWNPPKAKAGSSMETSFYFGEKMCIRWKAQER